MTEVDGTLRALAGAFELSPAAVVITDLSGYIAYVNPQFCELTGYLREELVAMHVRGLRENPADGRDLWQALEAGEGWQGRFWMKRKDGRIRWVAASISPIRGSDGIVTCYLGINEDLARRESSTEAGPAERAASPSSRHPSEYVFVADPNGTILFASAVVPGLDREEVIGATIYDYVPPEHRADLQSQIASVHRSGQAAGFRLAGVGPRGTTSLYAVRVGPIKHNGEVIALAFVSVDLSRQDQPSGRSDSEERLRTLSEAGIEGVVIHDDGRILEANDAIAEMYGYERSQIIGMHALDFAAPESRDAVLEHIRSGCEESYEAAGLRKDGSTFPAEICGKTIRYQDRDVRVAAIRDISSRRKPARHAHGLEDEAELSARELQVLELLALGLTNREAAGRLGVSTRTVDHHVSHILTKLHVPNRTAAVVAAEHTGLLSTTSEEL
ncbi:MAG: PAS domain S-box protein [Dehalococcoidia bacterium]|nr:PAS domain S-box protein [Dehalococcoidia bacterium]